MDYDANSNSVQRSSLKNKHVNWYYFKPENYTLWCIQFCQSFIPLCRPKNPPFLPAPRLFPPSLLLPFLICFFSCHRFFFLSCHLFLLYCFLLFYRPFQRLLVSNRSFHRLSVKLLVHLFALHPFLVLPQPALPFLVFQPKQQVKLVQMQITGGTECIMFNTHHTKCLM